MALQSWTKVRDDLLGLAPLPPEAETVSLTNALGRVTANDVLARNPLPTCTHAVMDGYALGSQPPGRFQLREDAPEALHQGEAISIATGEATPAGTVAVILAGQVVLSGDGIEITRASPRDNLRRVGEEAAQGDVIIRAAQVLDARHCALAAAAGLGTVDVLRKPRVAVLGIDSGQGSSPHLAVLSAALGGPRIDLTVLGSVRPEQLHEVLAAQASRHALIVVTGDSLGDEGGLLALALGRCGAAVSVKRANLKPAKPIIVARMPGGAAVIGLSGTAYAVMAAAHLFLRPLLQMCLFRNRNDQRGLAEAAFSRARQPGRAEALPVSVAWEGQRRVLRPAGRFGQLSALAAMDGFALIDADSGDIAPGDIVPYQPLLMPLV